MAYGNRESNYKRNANNAKKADIILEVDREISAKIDTVSAKVDMNNQKLEAALSGLGQGGSNAEVSRLSEIYNSLYNECAAIKREMRYLAAQNEQIFNALSEKIQQLTVAASGGIIVAPQTEQPVQSAQIDYNELAAKVAEMIPAQEYISPDLIASKVAEQLAINGMPAPSNAVEGNAVVSASAVPVDLKIDEDDLADRIALKVGGIKADDFDILVDDDGCESISDTIVKRLDYEVISSAIAEKLRFELASLAEGADYLSTAEKFENAQVHEQYVEQPEDETDKLPESEPDEITDDVESQSVEELLAEDEQSDKTEAREYRNSETDWDDVSEDVAEEIRRITEPRFDRIDEEISEIKAMLIGGAAIQASEDSNLVTVSEVTEDEETCEEPDEEFDELVEEIDEAPSEGEIMVAQMDADDGVDFENMMKYNRSFIARIIQSSDEQKEYYGRVKTALLSYAKVNSNIAWGAERFNKGRETIARFKIRGKTLCLYLALNPTEYQYSVYHHIDVSGNKSMNGTPMMIKIKSPRGVKKAIRLIDDMLEQRGGIKRTKSFERNYAAMYPYESIEELIEDGLVKDVGNNK